MVLAMPDSEAKKKWMKENSVTFAIKFMKKTDQDVIDYLQSRNKRDTILEVVRYYIEHHKEE